MNTPIFLQCRSGDCEDAAVIHMERTFTANVPVYQRDRWSGNFCIKHGMRCLRSLETRITFGWTITIRQVLPMDLISEDIG